MPYKIAEIDLLKPLTPITLTQHETGLAIIARFGGRIAGFDLRPMAPGTTLDTDDIANLLRDWFGEDLVAARLDEELKVAPADEAPLPSLTAAICTHNRPHGLKRLLESLVRLEPPEGAPPLDILIVDNASQGTETGEIAESFESARYVFEPRTGLDFARNAALDHATGEYLAFLDDDVVADRAWLKGFYKAWRENPGAGGFTGFVLPLALTTPAQILFERNGGFRRGARPQHHGQTKLSKPVYPCGSGAIGAGCNMAFRKDLLEELGGFDNALDTGAPLPGGGDLDIFYRVIRSGHAMAYEPQFAVYHEHRETLEQLKRQYRSWGVGFVTYLVKSWRTDKAMNGRQAATLLWWFGDRLRYLVLACLGRSVQKPSHALAELTGGIVGLLGEYDRSRARIRAIEEAHQ